MNDTLSTAFTDLNLAPAMQAILQQLGYTSMTPIQAASLPITLAILYPAAHQSQSAPFRRASHGAMPDPRTGRPSDARTAPFGACR
jgi:hypothetical protein